MKSRRGELVLLGLTAAAVLAVAGVLLHLRRTRLDAWSLVSPPGYGEAAGRMDELEAKGHFDDAVQAGLQSVKGRASDYFIYQMIAQAYTYRAYKEPQQSSKWAKLAAEYADKAMNANPTDLSNVFNVGQTYALAGDNLPTSESCFYYQKAADVLRELTPKLEGDRATIQGKVFAWLLFRCTILRGCLMLRDNSRPVMTACRLTSRAGIPPLRKPLHRCWNTRDRGIMTRLYAQDLQH